MTINRQVLLGATTACITIGAILWAYNWHYRRDTWPVDIQIAVLGSQIAGAGSLLAWEGYSAYGEGMHRWRYKIDERSEQLKGLCTNQEISNCKFTRTRRVNDGVVQTVHYSDGILIVEEVWS
jgi:hypothetical protein